VHYLFLHIYIFCGTVVWSHIQCFGDSDLTGAKCKTLRILEFQFSPTSPQTYLVAVKWKWFGIPVPAFPDCPGILAVEWQQQYCTVPVIFFSGLHHYECVAPLVANSLQSGRFWTRSTVSVHDSPWESRSFCTVFIQVICGCPGGLFQYTEGEEVKICFASTLLSIRAICPNMVRRRAWIISVSRGWLAWHWTSNCFLECIRAKTVNSA